MNMLKKIGSIGLLGIIILCSGLIIALSIRGIPGNPKPHELLATEWMDNGPFELSPERGRFALLYSFVEEKTVFFTRPLAEFSMPDLGYTNGRFVSLFAPAVSFIAMPGYLVGREFNAAQVGAFGTIAVFALVNMLLIRAIAVRLGLHTVAAAIAMLVFLFASPAYAYAVTLYQHHISTFLILLSLYLYISSTSLWATSIIWFLCAAAIPIDYPNLFLMFPIGLAELVKQLRITHDRRGITSRISLYAPLTLVSMILPLYFFFWFNQLSYGNPMQFSGTVQTAKQHHFSSNLQELPTEVISESTTSATTKSSEKNAVGFFSTRGLVNGLYILLVSQDRGLLYFTPVMLLGLIGAFSLYRRNRALTVLGVSIITINILFYAMYGDVWGGWAFGSRYLIPTYAILSIFIAGFLTARRKHWIMMVLFIVLASYSVLVNTAGALSSNANPPKVQVLELERVSGIEQKYTVMRNIDKLKFGSKSYIYQAHLNQYMTSWQFYQGMGGAILAMVFVLTGYLYFAHKKEII